MGTGHGESVSGLGLPNTTNMRTTTNCRKMTPIHEPNAVKKVLIMMRRPCILRIPRTRTKILGSARIRVRFKVRVLGVREGEG